MSLLSKLAKTTILGKFFLIFDADGWTPTLLQLIAHGTGLASLNNRRMATN